MRPGYLAEVSPHCGLADHAALRFLDNQIAARTVGINNMLDGFEILTTSGVVLWSKSYAPINSNIINGFVKDVFIEEKVLQGASVGDDVSAVQNPTYKREKYTVKWTTVKDLGLIFVVCF